MDDDEEGDFFDDDPMDDKPKKKFFEKFGRRKRMTSQMRKRPSRKSRYILLPLQSQQPRLLETTG